MSLTSFDYKTIYFSIPLLMDVWLRPLRIVLLGTLYIYLLLNMHYKVYTLVWNCLG